MRLLLLPLLALTLLPGCTVKRYLLDPSIPTKTALIGTELGRYGLDATQSQCVGGSLSAKLSVWELRQLRDALAARRSSSDSDAAALWRIVPQIRDARVNSEVVRAFETCGISAGPAPGDSAPRPTGLTELPPPSPAPPPQGRAPAPAPDGKIQNGPSNYEPSENLLQALEAFERKDFASAARLARSAADSGDSGAQQFLGGLYASGQGVRADVPAALRYYAQAAEQGWSEAMNNLAKAFESGTGIGRDPVLALKWYLLASARATEDEQMVAANMQNLLRTMSIADIEKASALAREWEAARAE
ncbi:MAG TPA: tetratricopeptide repeat protein [Allosphingosinicella sp.]|jgi:hypothetical protein